MHTEFKISILSLIVIIIVIYLMSSPTSEFMSRPVWHDPRRIIDFKLDGKGTSQQIMDIYSLSHITHGIILYFILKMVKINPTTGFIIAIIIESIWEIYENTPYIINKYRENKAYENYKGDSIVNMLGDLMSMMMGYYLSYNSKKYAIIYVILTEICLIPINANLLHLSFGSLMNGSK
jgi:hypothetical protein